MAQSVPFARTAIFQPSLTVADLLLRSGEQQADAERRRGEISAQMWNGIGNSIASIPAQIVAAKRAQTRDQLDQQEMAARQGQIASANQLRSGQAAVDRLMAGDQLPAGDVGPRQDSYLDSKGLFDVPKLTDALGKSGYGHLAPELLKGAESINESILKHQAIEQQASQQQAMLLGDLAHGALTLHQNVGMPLSGAIDFVVQPALATKRISPEQVAQFKQQIDAMPPDQQVAALNQVRDQAARLDKPKTIAKDTIEVDRYGRTTASNVSPDKPTEASIALAAAGGDPVKANQFLHSAQAETARHNAEMEKISRLTQGREAASQIETARHNRATEAANNPLAGMASGGGQPQSGAAQPPQVAGDEFLKTLNPNIANQVKALAEGRMQFPAGFALKSPYWQSMIQAVSQYDPSFDAVNYNARSSTRKDFTSGKSAAQVNALNTVLGHLNGLSDAAEALNNTDYPALNSVLNTLSKAVGRPNVTNFDTIKKAVADEVTRVWRQAGGSAEDIRTAQENLSAANSPDQLRGAIATYGDLLQSKLGSLSDQYKQGMGTAPVNMLKPENQAVLDKISERAGNAKTPASAPASEAPLAVKSALSGKGPGRYTLSDGSQWVIDGTGTIRKGS